MRPHPRAVLGLPLALEPRQIELVEVDVRAQDVDVEGLLLVVVAGTRMSAGSPR